MSFLKTAPIDPQTVLEYRIPFGFLVVDMSNEQKIISLNSVTEEILSVEAANGHWQARFYFFAGTQLKFDRVCETTGA